MFSRLAVVVLLSCAAVQGATVSLQPSASTVSPGQVFSLEIAVNDVVDLFAYQFDLGYNQTLVEATSIVEGPFLGAGGSTFFIAGTIDNSSGLISATANSLLGASPGVAGSGVLASVNFRGIGAGTSPINLLNVTLLDSSLSGITPTIQNAEVSVEATNIPEPGALQLLGAAVVLFAGSRILGSRRRRVTGSPRTKV